MSKSLLVGSTLALLVAAGGCETAELQGAEAEVKPHNIKLDLPPVPEFNLPNPNPDGTHPVEEMRLRGKRYFGQSVQIKGYVVWIYDCATALRSPEMSEKDVKAYIDEDPTRCTRPNFYLGATPTAPRDKGVRIVENPRMPRKDELKSDKEGSKLMIEAFKLVPPFKVGDEVTVTGKWVTKSPRGFRDSNGLMVFESLVNNTVPVEAPPAP